MIVAVAAVCVVAGCNKIDDPEQKDDPQDDHNYLTFEAVEAGATVKLEIFGKLEAPSLEFSTNKLVWTAYDFGKPQTITLKNVGDKVYWRNTGTTNKFSTFGDYIEDYIHFDLGAKKIAASGNIMSLLDINCEMNEMPDDACFEKLFDSNSMLVSAPELPATKLSPGCYFGMFRNCSSLRTAPALPAETLTESCYYLMFGGCTSLKKVPELPAAKAVSQCYVYMFMDCTSLVEAPELPATELDRFCYYGMFLGCTKLKKAPELPAEKLGIECYGAMFRGCTSLEEAPELPVMDLAEDCYSQMFLNCVSLKTAPELPATNLVPECYSYMFYGCSSLENAPELPAAELASDCYYAMFYECTSLKSAPALPATELAVNCYGAMYGGCTSLEAAPYLPAVTLVERCYDMMFYKCSKLNSIKVAFTDWDDGSATLDWVFGIAQDGTFECPSALPVKYGKDNIPIGWNVNRVAPAAAKSLAVPASCSSVEKPAIGAKHARRAMLKPELAGPEMIRL